MFSCEYCEILENRCFNRTLLVAAFVANQLIFKRVISGLLSEILEKRINKEIHLMTCSLQIYSKKAQNFSGQIFVEHP